MAKLRPLKKISTTTNHTQSGRSSKTHSGASGTSLVSLDEVKRLHEKIVKKMDEKREENTRKAALILHHWLHSKK